MPSPLARAPENPGFRFYIGLALFILSFFMLPTGLLLKGYFESTFWKGFVLAVFWLSAPLMKLSSIAILGKPSYEWIRYRIRHLYTRVAGAKKVSRTRYNIGLFMFVVPFIPNYIMAYAPHLFPQEYLIRTIIHSFFDVIFISSLFVLGGDFWDKLRALFMYTAKANFAGEGETAGLPADH
jgi:hypothetical protein